MSVVTEIRDILLNAARDEQHRKIGIELERIGIWPDCTPFRYQQSRSDEGEMRPGADILLTELSKKYGWPITANEEGQPLGLKLDCGNITLEPGSQVELATEATVELDSLIECTNEFEAQVDAVTNPWKLNWIGLGVNCCNSVGQMDVIPSERYGVMTDYMERRGSLATTMMRLTSSVQINLDYRSEEEGIEMLRTALAAAPTSYALFSNSPLLQGKEIGWASFRGNVWENTDSDRVGLLHEAFAEDFSFEKYAEIVASRPLMFALNDKGHYVASEGKSLNQIEAGELSGVSPIEGNQQSGLRQLFFEARLKPGYVEVRSVDGLRPAERYASAAYWMGLLYDSDARALVLDRTKNWTPKFRDELLREGAKEAMRASVDGVSLAEVTKEFVAASKEGLKRRGFGEEKYLAPVEKTLETGLCPADRVLKLFRETPEKKIKTVIAYVGKTGLAH